MKKRLIIIGAGGLGREVFAHLHQNPGTTWTLGGFIEDNAESLRGFDLPIGIVDSVQNYKPRPNTLLLPAIGDPIIKLRICRELSTRGAVFSNFIHPTAVISYKVKLGVGIFIFPGAIVGPFSTIGDFVSIGGNATVGHDAAIGDGCTLCGHTEINGWTQLGEAVLMGSHATVLPKVKIGDGCVLGAGSTTISSVKPRTTMFGMAAKRLVIGP